MPDRRCLCLFADKRSISFAVLVASGVLVLPSSVRTQIVQRTYFFGEEGLCLIVPSFSLLSSSKFSVYFE